MFASEMKRRTSPTERISRRRSGLPFRPCPPEELSSSRSFVHSFKKSRVIPKRTAYFSRNAILQKVIRMILQEAASPENPFVSFSGKLNSSTGIQLSGKSWPSFENHGHLFTRRIFSCQSMTLFCREWSCFPDPGPSSSRIPILFQEWPSPENHSHTIRRNVQNQNARVAMAVSAAGKRFSTEVTLCRCPLLNRICFLPRRRSCLAR